ncbi:RNA metabolism protein [Lithospermum erythrorhizon]|uniref:RNA metabolism protein n=1 Tax=Lithospermum erythrorhizon TaxID=34254 RepID=A0AAV3PF47_LITER
MSLQQIGQPRSSANGFGLRRNDRDSDVKAENRLQTGKAPGRSSSVGENLYSLFLLVYIISLSLSTRWLLDLIGKEGVFGSLSRERLVYLTTCFIGHNVEVQVMNGSVYSGIFHATNAEDFGIILKMAQLIKDGSRGAKSNSDLFNKPPSKVLIIPSEELVQVIAKGVPVTCDGSTPELLVENKQELMTDSYISQSRHVEMQRELERWVPDDDVPECPELENIFDGSWHRGWDQFEVNKTLFGVKSTFDEELYTTRLEKGPQMRELEKEALRIAREIEGEDTSDLHLAEERGLQLHGNLEVDEETRFSSVFRKVDDSGYDDTEEILLDYRNDETFGGVPSSTVHNIVTELSNGKTSESDQLGGRTFPMEGFPMSQSSTSRDFYQSVSDDSVRQHTMDHFPTLNDNRVHINPYAEHVGGNNVKEDIEKKKLAEQGPISKPDDACSSLKLKEEDSGKARLSADATSYAPPLSSLKLHDKGSSPSEKPVAEVFSKTQGTSQSSNSRSGPSISTSSNSDNGIPASTSGGPRISPSSSMGSLTSEKSTLNPHAKEFRLNPKAKSFSPSQTPMRPASPVSDGSLYYHANMATVPHMHGMPVGVGLRHTYPAHQPVVFNPQSAPTAQAYFPPGGPQMMFGHPRQQLVYMPPYPAEMQYKGREY